MGYRSDVAYIIAAPAEDMVAFITKCRMSEPETEIALKECTLSRLGNKLLYLAYGVSNVKWYDSYPEVDSHNKLWSLAGEAAEANPFEGQKCVIGESDDDADNDDFGAGEYGLYTMVSISRSIVFDVNAGPEYDVRDKLEETLTDMKRAADEETAKSDIPEPTAQHVDGTPGAEA